MGRRWISTLPPTVPSSLCDCFPYLFCFNFVFSLFNVWRHNSLSLSLYFCCVDYSRQGLPYPPSGYAEMDNAVPPDRYGNYSPPFSPIFVYACVFFFLSSFSNSWRLKKIHKRRACLCRSSWLAEHGRMRQLVPQVSHFSFVCLYVRAMT